MKIQKVQMWQIARFAIVAVLSFIAFEAVEHSLSHFFGIELDEVGTGAGWVLLVIAYGFKTHILCCLVPLLWAAYRCRHRGCEHDHCKNDKTDEPHD
jgi:hypothetical protein